MPITLPTVYALRFVRNNDLMKRINVIQNSYKAQFLSFCSITTFNLKEYIAVGDFNYLFTHLYLLY
jgi:hypothetical protein